MNFFLAVLSSIILEGQSLTGYLWYLYYVARYSALGDRMSKLPAPLVKIAPYAKLVVVVAAIVAGVVVQVVAGPPAWALLIIAVAGAIGVGGVRNAGAVSQVVSGLKDIVLTYQDGVAVLKDMKTGDTSAISVDVNKIQGDVKTDVAAVPGAVDTVVSVVKSESLPGEAPLVPPVVVATTTPDGVIHGAAEVTPPAAPAPVDGPVVPPAA